MGRFTLNRRVIAPVVLGAAVAAVLPFSAALGTHSPPEDEGPLAIRFAAAGSTAPVTGGAAKIVVETKCDPYEGAGDLSLLVYVDQDNAVFGGVLSGGSGAAYYDFEYHCTGGWEPNTVTVPTWYNEGTFTPGEAYVEAEARYDTSAGYDYDLKSGTVLLAPRLPGAAE